MVKGDLKYTEGITDVGEIDKNRLLEEDIGISGGRIWTCSGGGFKKKERD